MNANLMADTLSPFLFVSIEIKLQSSNMKGLINSIPGTHTTFMHI